MSDHHLVEVNRYSFTQESLEEIRSNAHAKTNWPLVYILSNGKESRAYVGETTDTLTRMSTHLKHETKSKLTSVHLISSERFNKSATLDVESRLIKYMSADGKYSLLNGNLGLADHNYYQKDDLYDPIFRKIWEKLRSAGLAQASLESIDNSDLFKYSPYKSLSSDQRQSLLGIMHALLDDQYRNILVQGGAGTGKSILAIFLFKLLNSTEYEFNFKEFSSEEAELRELLKELKTRYPNPKMALVVPMSSFRSTLKKAFSNISGLRGSMVIGPAELAKERYDIVLVDESHRLRKRKNLGSYFKAFDNTCEALGFDKEKCSEVDWVCKQSDKSIFFYDESQSIRPSDANVEDFINLQSSHETQTQRLSSQFRVRGGNAYVEFIDNLLRANLSPGKIFHSKSYELILFDSISEMTDEIKKKNQEVGLSRLISGYSWPWISQKSPELFDITIENTKLRWNSTNQDWINSKGAEFEVGCIHTTQGYDLNYSGIIFGEEISYDDARKEITIDAKKYYDRNGKSGIKDPQQLKQYIVNIYKTIMLRGIRGTYVYACNAELRNYLKHHIPAHIQATQSPKKIIKFEPFVNCVPFYDIQAAAGNFSALQHSDQKSWISAPEDVHLTEDLFACKVVGESMNRIIPSGSNCLFRLERGGSRNGRIVLVECSDIFNDGSGSRYTVKEYESIKIEDETGLRQHKILLKPLSYDRSFEAIELSNDSPNSYKIIGEFVKVLE